MNSLPIASSFLAFVFFVSSDLTTAQGQTVKDVESAITALSNNSPAGGPKNNPTAAVVVFFRKESKLCWIDGGKVKKVSVTATSEKDDTKQGGPTPPGEYLIGNRFTHKEHTIDWYRLYPKIEDDSGYYGYTAKTKTGRFAMGLHPGSVSAGCVTVSSKTDPYDKSEDWKAVRALLDKSSLKYKNDSFDGFLYVIDK